MIRNTFKLLCLGCSLQPAFALFEVGTDANFLSTKYNQTTTIAGFSGSSTAKFNGFLAGVYGHFTFGLPKLITIGIGPQLAVSGSNRSDLPATLTKSDVTLVRYGGDVKIQLEMLPYVSPYLRGAFGQNSITAESENSTATSTTKTKFSENSFYYNAILGIQIPLGPMFALFAQGGITGSTAATGNTTTTINSGSGSTNAGSVPSELSYTGFLAGAGVRWAF